MKKVKQKEVHQKTGDCMRASIASVLEIDIEAVPHLTRTNSDKWFTVLYYFMIAYGWKYRGMWHPATGKRKLLLRHSFNGFYLASVKSKTYDGATHMIVMDRNWKVAHDPSPNKKWQGKSLRDSSNLVGVYTFRKMDDTDKEYWDYL